MLDEIYKLAAAFAGQVSQQQETVLKNLCKVAEAELCARLRPEVDPAECAESFVCAAAWLALANLACGKSSDGITAFTAGEMGITKGAGDQAANCLRVQAEALMAPYCRDTVAFLGVTG